ncbi:hypothetical protein LCGC14_1182410 [marine sediment metagenome]|uniref:Uncharacterized protein n=1 Tax=marine sediment metagenome TaxID=412755 RepID=A0A0F9PS92_9ZZZZ
MYNKHRSYQLTRMGLFETFSFIAISEYDILIHIDTQQLKFDNITYAFQD